MKDLLKAAWETAVKEAIKIQVVGSDANPKTFDEWFQENFVPLHSPYYCDNEGKTKEAYQDKNGQAYAPIWEVSDEYVLIAETVQFHENKIEGKPWNELKNLGVDIKVFFVHCSYRPYPGHVWFKKDNDGIATKFKENIDTSD